MLLIYSPILKSGAEPPADPVKTPTLGLASSAVGKPGTGRTGRGGGGGCTMEPFDEWSLSIQEST